MASELRELIEKLAKAGHDAEWKGQSRHKWETCDPAIQDAYRRCAKGILAALDAAEVPTKPEVCPRCKGVGMEELWIGEFVPCRDCAAPEVAQARWRPIETAPKDGRQLIVGVMTTMGWNWGVSRYERFNEHLQGWISHSNGVWGTLGLAHPTHWMPLPDPPAALDRARKGGE